MIEHSIDYAMGVGFGIFIAIIILIVFKKTNLSKKPEFDERQLYEQGRANTIAYRFTLAGMGLTLFLYGFKDEISFEIVPVAILAVIVLSVTVFVVYCIFHDAYFTKEQIKPSKKLVVLWFVVIAVNLFSFIVNIKSGGIFSEGRTNIGALSALVILILFSTLLIASYIHSYSVEKDIGDDEDVMDSIAGDK